MTAGDPPGARPPSPVGFVGLGMMGSEIAGRLLDSGCSLVVHNRTAGKAAPLLEKGAVWAASPAEVAKRVPSGLIFLMLTNEDAVRAVLFGPAGVAESASDGTVVVDLSTIGPDQSRRNSQELARGGVHYVDAPVVGSTEVAISGSLLVLVGGAEGDVERARPLLRHFGRRVEHLGPVGSGASMKLVNNLLMGSNMAVLGEALALGDAFGLDRPRVVDLLADGGGSSRVLEAKREFLVRSEFPPHFKLVHARKDVALASDAAGALGLAMKITPQVRMWFDLAFDEQRGDQDFSSVVATEMSRLESPGRTAPKRTG